ncbi:ATP-binding cassette domain-containing protein [Planococcus sp. CAU13]|uniref:ATP-binding cassette domain-containing protein n=1 Tax=Planococcus sp. CAU13 TaxID=1541197 RepID=UPI00052FF527|nr:ATP-binding cassette domain-containing protein [Planococcus sp. CAU13]
MKPIQIRKAMENNLKGFDITIPKNQLVVFSGVSGSGKSSLVFDTVAVESQRQLNDTFPLFIKHKLPKYERPKADSIENLTPAITVSQKKVVGSSRSTVSTMIDIAPLFRLLFSRCAEPGAGVATAYSFNSPRGMCPVCKGIGETVKLDLTKLLDTSKSLNEGAIQFKPWATTTWQWRLYGNSGFFDNNKKLADYTKEEWHNLLHGSGRKVIIENDPSGVWYEGVADRFNRLYIHKDVDSLSTNVRSSVQKVVSIECCDSCNGKRLNEKALQSKIQGMNIAEVFDLELVEVMPFLEKITDEVGKSLAASIFETLERVIDLGLGYLKLSRTTSTLSGGEAQRLKLVKHLGSSLTGMTYILDEPSTGMHPSDVEKIIKILKQLRDNGNSVLVVEHDQQIIQAADEIIELGPEAGATGGYFVFQGTPNELINTSTATAQNLSKKTKIKQPSRTFDEWITVENASLHNLKNVSARFPKNALTTATGVSGSGKSSLVLGELTKHYPKAIVMDQKPVGTSIRSTLATYLGIMDAVRVEFADKTGQNPGLFSFNSLGKCPNCGGKGVTEADMVYADPVIVICEECQGLRYSNEALSYKYHNKNISEVLEMTSLEAANFFNSPVIAKKLAVLDQVGLGYITLGQSTTTLSGGEIQRMKIAAKLKSSGELIILDEPTNGLHMADVEFLMKLLRSLVDDGNTVILIEHDLQVIAKSDWVVDIGPGGGKFGGQVLFEGPPSGLINCTTSITGKWMASFE